MKTRDGGIEGGVFYLIRLLPDSVVDRSAGLADVLGPAAKGDGIHALFPAWEIRCGVFLGAGFWGVARVYHFAYGGEPKPARKEHLRAEPGSQRLDAVRRVVVVRDTRIL